MTNYTIHQGNALDVLRGMPDESVQCSITSPPYYGLRSYKTEPQIWDGDEFCDHEWGATVPFAKQGTRTVEQIAHLVQEDESMEPGAPASGGTSLSLAEAGRSDTKRLLASFADKGDSHICSPRPSVKDARLKKRQRHI